MTQQINVKGYTRRVPHASERLATQIALLNSREVAENGTHRLTVTVTEILAADLDAALSATDFSQVQ